MLNWLVSEGRKMGLVINCRKNEIINMNMDNVQDCLHKLIRKDDTMYRSIDFFQRSLREKERRKYGKTAEKVG